MINKDRKFFLMDMFFFILIHLNLQVVFQKAKKYAALFCCLLKYWRGFHLSKDWSGFSPIENTKKYFAQLE